MLDLDDAALEKLGDESYARRISPKALSALTKTWSEEGVLVAPVGSPVLQRDVYEATYATTSC